MKLIKSTLLSILFQASYSIAGVSGYVKSSTQMYPGASLGVYAAEAENGLATQAAIFCKRGNSTVQTISNSQIQIVGNFSVTATARNGYMTTTGDYPNINSIAFVICK